MKIKRALSTSHHPQTDGQTEVMNQILEVALRCYVSPEKDDWDAYLDEFAFSYNNTPHSSTGYKPSFLLYGYHPTDAVDRLPKHTDDVLRPLTKRSITSTSLDIGAEEFLSEMSAHRIRAKDSLVLAQATQQRFYNKGRTTLELTNGDLVLLNLKTLRIHNAESSLGKKLEDRFDGPFEVLERVGPTSYRLRLPSSYGIHNVINIAHLEPYRSSPKDFGPRASKISYRSKIAEPEWEVDEIVGEIRRKIGRSGRRIPYYRVRYKEFGPEHDEWIPRTWLKNAPEVLRRWEATRLANTRLQRVGQDSRKQQNNKRY